MVTFVRPAAVLAATVLVGSLLAACGGDKPGGGSAASPSELSLPELAPDPDRRCGAEGGEAVIFTAEDGVKLAGAHYGAGGRGVVLLHQRGADLCGWAGFVPDLVEERMQVLAIDMRCNGYSNCPSDDSGDDNTSGGRDYAADAGAAIAELHRSGAAKVAVMGASLGAATAFVAGGRYADQVSAVVALSLFDASYAVSTTSDIASATDAAPHITAPILLCLSIGDPDSIQETRAQSLIDAAPSKAASSIVVRDEGAHGWAMLPDETVHAKVLDFLTQHT